MGKNEDQEVLTPDEEIIRDLCLKIKDLESGIEVSGMKSMGKPKKCCKPGEFTCQIPIPICGKVQGIDFCVAHIVSALNAGNIQTLASCCGHGEMTGSIILGDGRELVVRKYDESNYNKG